MPSKYNRLMSKVITAVTIKYFKLNLEGTDMVAPFCIHCCSSLSYPKLFLAVHCYLIHFLKSVLLTTVQIYNVVIEQSLDLQQTAFPLGSKHITLQTTVDNQPKEMVGCVITRRPWLNCIKGTKPIHGHNV